MERDSVIIKPDLDHVPHCALFHVMEPLAALPPVCRKPPLPAKAPRRPAEVFHVPRRFGLLAILTMLTMFSVLFAGLRALDAPPATFIGLGAFGVIVGGLQMAHGEVPRAVSIAAGATLVPLTVLTIVVMQSGWWALHFVATFPVLILLGGFLGYLVGTIMAGVFLIADLGERKVFSRRSKPPEEISAKL